MDKTVFISYSWDSDEHKSWVRNLVDVLIKNGVQVLLDQYDIQPGGSFTNFMESSISNSEKVLVILTPNYKSKSLERKGGVGYEQQIISGEIMSGIDREKFIPLIRHGRYEEGPKCAVPPHFKGISTLDFRDSENNQESIEELLRVIYDEPKFVKPSIGKKPSFEKTSINPSLVIELDKSFNCIQSESYVTDLFLRISDLRRSNAAYKLVFEIDGISEKYVSYMQLAEKHNLSAIEIQKKLQLREYLNQVFFLPNGTLYEYLTYSINSIIDYSFNKFKFISNYQDLYTSLTRCLQHFSSNHGTSDTTKFDVFNNKIKWDFSIRISKNEVEKLLSVLRVKDKMLLTAIGGLDVYDLSHSSLIEDVIPKGSYQFTSDYFQKRINEDFKEECLNVSGWKIGLA